MLLEVQNIGKIQKASIEMRGITVIAGNNNTGKSTYGKILYCMFNAFCNAGAAIYEERKSNIEDIIFSTFLRFRSPLTNKLINIITEQPSSAEELRNHLKKAISDEILFIYKSEDNTIDAVVEKIMQSNEVVDEQIQKMFQRCVRVDQGRI
jgi:predicted ATPase